MLKRACTDSLLRPLPQHHLLTAFALGGTPDLLQKIFEVEKTTLVPLNPVARQKELAKSGRKIRLDVPELDANNWADFLGVGDAYGRYLVFFEQELAQRGVTATLDRYLFSEEAVRSALVSTQKDGS